jgi:hypothetical protein
MTSPGLSPDCALVRFIGRCGVVSIEHVMAFLRVGRTAAYRRVAYLIEAGLLERLELLRAAPSLICATAAGLRWAGTGLTPVVVSPGSVEHWLRCTSTALVLGERYGHQRVFTERDIALLERVEERPVASAKLAEARDGRLRLHRPDLAVLTDERSIAVEVELTPKAPRRLKEIMRAWRRASWVGEVHYHCAPGLTRRAVERAVAKTHSQERVRIFEAVER